MFATKLQRIAYARIAKPIFFRQDPEKVHDRIVRLGRLLGVFPLARPAVAFIYRYQDPILSQEILGMQFANPIGLAAGFDKDAALTDIIPAVGFGFQEIGSVTGEPCTGNSGTRLWRMPKSKALVVWYGLKNDGAAAIAQRLSRKRSTIPLGTSVAKTNSPATIDIDAGIADYAKAFAAFAHIGNYTTVNISCPNAFGGEPFTDPDRLDALLMRLDTIPTEKPIFLKVSADLTTVGLDALVAVADRHRVDGFIVANLSKRRDLPGIATDEAKVSDKGGISGRPVAELSDRLIAHLARTTDGRYVIIGCGGVFSAEDAYRKIRLGASLLQLITGMIYEGPQLIGEINRDLAALLERDGFATITDAVGADLK